MMVRLKSVRSDSYKSDESGSSVENVFPELKHEKSKRSKTELDILQKIYDRQGAQWKRFDQIEERLTQLEEVKKIVAEILDQTSKLSNLKSSKTDLTSQVDSQPGSSVTSHFEDVIDNSMSEETSVTNNTDKTSEPPKRVKSNESSLRPTVTNESGVSEASQTKPTDNFASYLEMIETDCGKLKCVLEKGMMPNTKSLLRYVLHRPKQDTNLTDAIGAKETYAINESETTAKPHGNVKNNTQIPELPEYIDSQESQTKTIDTSQSHLSRIETDSNEIASTSLSVHNTATRQIKDIVPPPKMPIDEKVLQKTDSSLKPLAGKLCFLCNKVAKLGSCGKCIENKVLPKEEIPAYCAQPHKDLHWASGHDKCCGKKALKLGWKEVRGNEKIHNGLPYYVASKDLEPGHNIFTKKPLFTFPRNVDKHDIFTFSNKFPKLEPNPSEGLNYSVCIICYELMLYGQLMEDPLLGIRLNECPSCGWPVHSPRDVNLQKVKINSCQEEHEKECKIFRENGITGDKARGMKGFSWFCLAALRAVINPVQRQKLLNLPVSSRPHFYHEFTYKFVREDCKQYQVSDEELNRIINVIASNSLRSSAAYFSIRKKYYCTIYEGGHTGTILPHACNPNCNVYVNPKTGEATFKTRRKVKQDEMLTINYLVDAFPQPINERARFLSFLDMPSNTLAYCNCDKCKDGEDSTSAMKWPKGANKHKKGCRSQYLTPYLTRLEESQPGSSTRVQVQPNVNKEGQVNPDTNNLYFWQCKSCKSLGSRMEQSAVQKTVGRIRAELREAFFQWNYGELKEIIQKYSDVELHPDHSLLLFAYVTLGYFVVIPMRTGVSFFEKIGSDFHLFLLDLDKAIEMLNRLDNGRSEIYGVLLYHQTLLKMRQLTEKISTKKSSEVQTALESIKKNLKESWEIIENNPHLSASEINRDICLFDLYSRGLEFRCKGLVKDSKGSIFERFRTMQKRSLGIELMSPLRGSFYLYEFKLEGNEGSSKKTEGNVTQSGEDERNIMVKMKIEEEGETMSGAFLREIFFRTLD